MSGENVDYDAIIEEQAKLIEKKGQAKRKNLITKDVQYFDSTELPKLLNQPETTEKTEKNDIKRFNQ